MSNLPFTMTPEGEATIEKTLIDAQREPSLLPLAPTLAFTFNSSWTSKEGGGGCYPFGHVVIGWYRLDEVAGNDEYTELELVGFRVFAHKNTLEQIRGKRIELDIGKGMAGTDVLPVKTMAPSAGLGESST